MTRYARQIALPEVGPTGQERLRAARVLVVGAGGLGVPVLHYLAGAGVGSITVVDGDRVEEANLHRQPLYRMDDLGRSKAEAAAQALRALNSDVVIQPQTRWLDPACAPDLVAEADVVLDCADTFAASLTLSDTCRDADLPLISGSALGLTGYAGGFCGGAPSLRAVFPDLPQTAASCASAGVLGPVVAMIGAVQAHMALAVMLELTPSPLGTMMIFDAKTLHASRFRFDAAPEPQRTHQFVAISQIRRDDLIVDLRAEAPAPFHPNAVQLSPERLARLTPSADTARIVLACRTGLRAFNAAQTLAERWPGPIGLLAIPPL